MSETTRPSMNLMRSGPRMLRGAAQIGAMRKRVRVHDLTHVRDIEEASLLAGPHVRGERAVGILNGHVPAAEGGHLGTELHVERVQGGLLERLARISARKSARDYERQWHKICTRGGSAATTRLACARSRNAGELVRERRGRRTGHAPRGGRGRSGAWQAAATHTTARLRFFRQVRAACRNC